MIFSKVKRGQGIGQSAKGDAEKLVAAGNSARDAGEWRAAAMHYEAYVALIPGDAGIWVQLGNCAKEAGQFKLSLRAYQKALVLRPTDADAHLQLGHLFKLMGRLADAQISYRTALQIDPELADARQELSGLQSTIDSLPFLLPPTFLDFLSADSPQSLLEKCVDSDPQDDPFRKYAELLK